MTFLTHRAAQAKELREAGTYTLFKTHSDGSFTRVPIFGYDAFGLDGEYEACVDVVSRMPYVALPIFPGAIEDMGKLLADGIKKRLVAGDNSAMDLLICVNFCSLREKSARRLRETWRRRNKKNTWRRRWDLWSAW